MTLVSKVGCYFYDLPNHSYESIKVLSGMGSRWYES